MIVESLEDVIVLTGPLRANFWEAIRTAIALTLHRHPTGVIIDCHGISEINESGAKTFQQALDFVHQHDSARVIFARVPDHVIDVLREVPEVRSQLAITATVEEARRSLDLVVSDPESAKRIDRKKSFNRQILAVQCPNHYDPHVLEVTTELISDRFAKLVIVLPIMVPRELPLQAPMPEEEARAEKFIHEAKELLRHESFAYELRLERTRDLPTLVAETAEEIDAAHIVIGIAADHSEDQAMNKVIRNVMDRVNRSLLFVRGKVEESAEAGARFSEPV